MKTVPAGKGEKINITYTHFAANQERGEIAVGEGKEFDNDALLTMLGFEKDENGELKLPTSNYEIEIADNGEIIRRKVKDKVLTENKTEDKGER